MSIIIKDIYYIDPQSVEFTVDGSEDGEVVYPERAYEITAVVNGKKIDTYGVIWMNDNKATAFIDEEFENFIRRELKDLISEQHISALNDLIFKKYDQQDIELPYTIL